MAGSFFLTSRIYVGTTEPRIIGLSSVAGRNAQTAAVPETEQAAREACPI